MAGRPRKGTRFDPKTGLKVCASCQEAKPASAFYAHPKAADGLMSYCKACQADLARARRVAPAPAALELPGDPFTVGHFDAWARAMVVLADGESLELEPFQRSFLSDVFAGARACWLIVPEGNGKTTLIAALALYHCQFRPYASVPTAASSRDQAELIFRQAEGIVQRSDALSVMFRCQPGNRRILFAEQGFRGAAGPEATARIQIFAADDRTGDGVIPTLCIVDELHRHRDLRLYRTWSGKIAKRDGQIVAISTAGEPGSEFEQTRERILNSAEESKRDGAFVRAVAGGVVLHDWSVPADANVEDMAEVKQANPFTGVTVELLRAKRESPSMVESHWRRFVCNQPTNTDQDPFVSTVEWDALGDGEGVPEGATVCLGADGSRTWDTTVVAWASVADDGRVDVDASVFSVREEAPHHVLHEGGKIDFDDVEEFALDCFDRFRVWEVAYDPRYLERSMELAERRLPESRIAAVEPTSKHMRDALQTLHALIVEGRLRHSGDPVLAAHVANTRAWRGEQGEIRRVAKMDPRKPIDAVPAMALAVWRATREKQPAEPMVAYA